MQVDLNGRVAIVTGAAQGIGKAIVKAFCQNGATVVVSDIQCDAGAVTASEWGDKAIFVPCDVTDFGQVESLVRTATDRFGRLDIMVNNAGINAGPDQRVTVDDYPCELWKKIIDTDLTGAFHGCKAAAGQMVKQRSGSIINIASVAGVVALRLQIGYVAAKAGVIKMTEGMACELGPMGIRVNAVTPGSVLADGTRHLFYDNKELSEKMMSFIPMRRPAEVDDIAHAVLYLASDAASYVNGLNLVVDGGWTCGFSRDF